MTLNRPTTPYAGLLAVLLLVCGNAGSTPIFVDPTSSGSDVDAEIVWEDCIACFVDADLAAGLEGSMAFLDVGDAYTFDFLNLRFGGLIGAALVNVEATLALSSPGTTATGNGFGGFASLFFLLNGGFLTWDQPDPISLGDGSWLGIEFENLFGFGVGNRATVAATVYRYGEPYGEVAVAEPGTPALFGLGLFLLWLAVRRRWYLASHA